MLSKMFNLERTRRTMTAHSGYQLDALDSRLLHELAAHPRSSILETARRLQVARNTVYARIARLTDAGVIKGFGPDVDLAAIGFAVTAFTTIEVVQGNFGDVVGELAQMPEVVEVHTVAGQGDLLVRIAASTNAAIMEVVERILRVPGVDRTTTAISLAEQIRLRTLPLVEKAANG